MELRDANLQVYEKKLLHTSFFMYFSSFSQNASQLLLRKRLWKCPGTISFRKYRRGYSVRKRLVKLLGSKVSPCSCLDIKMYLRYHLCCVINFNTLVWCSSVQDQLKTASQWKDSIPYILTYSQFCKTSINLQSVKQDLFSLIPKQPFTWVLPWILQDVLEHLFRITYDNHIQNRCSGKSRKIHGKTPVQEYPFNKVTEPLADYFIWRSLF